MRQWLFEERMARNKTQLQMAQELGITESYYSYIENGERQKKMEISLALKLADVLKIPVGEIIEHEQA